MRFAPPPAMRVVDRGGGLNQTSVRTYNERLVMSLLRQHEALSRMEIGQHSGLSAQTVSVIVRSLERDNMILPGEAQRGRVGPPSIPMALNPEGAFAIGIKIGAKSCDVVLVDFVGRVLHHVEQSYAFPDLDKILAGLGDSIAAMIGFLSETLATRIVGIGISLPDEIETWPRPDWNAPVEASWKTVDFEASIGRSTDIPIYIQNDVTAAAGAEALFGAARKLGDFAYFFVGARSASRLVLNRHIYAGRRGLDASAKDGPVTRHGRSAHGARLTSLSDLERSLGAAGIDASEIWRYRDVLPDYGKVFEDWVDVCSGNLADAILLASAFVDIDTAIIDGRFPPAIRDGICEKIRERLENDQALGGDIPAILSGQIGPFAKAVGAASLPFYSRFMVEDVGLASPQSVL